MNISSKDWNETGAYLQDTWQEPFLQKILFLAATVGLFAIVPAVISTSNLILQSIYIGVFALLVTVTLIRLPYLVKATAFVLLPLVLGIASLAETGIRGDSLFFFLAFITFSCLFIGSRTGFVAIVFTELIIAGMGYLVLNDMFTLSDKLAFEGDWVEWVIAITSQLLISLVIVFALRLLNENFRHIHQYSIEMHRSQILSQKELENRIAERTQELSRKTYLLNATAVVTHQTAISQDLDQLLNKTVNLISERLGCYHVGIYLINQRGDYVTLQAASSEGGKRLLEEGFRIRVGMEGIIGFVASEKKARISMDVEKDVIFFDNPELSDTRSELSMPLLVNNKVVGVLDLQSSEVDAFRYNEIDIFQSMADQIAVTIENVRLLTESQLVISQLEILSDEKTRQNWKSEADVHKAVFRYSLTGVHPVEKIDLKKQKVGNILAVPIVLRGQKIGTISLQRKAEFQKWTTQEESIANEVAVQTALALENIRLVERTRERANREQVISNVSARIRETLDLDIVLRTTAREIQKALNLQEAEIRLLPQINSADKRDMQAPF